MNKFEIIESVCDAFRDKMLTEQEAQKEICVILGVSGCFYHGTTKKAFKQIINDKAIKRYYQNPLTGLLEPDDCVYLTPDVNFANQFEMTLRIRLPFQDRLFKYVDYFSIEEPELRVKCDIPINRISQAWVNNR